MKPLATFLAILLMTFGASIPAVQSATPSGVAAGYRVGPGDKLRITVYNETKISGDYTVSGDGKIALPMVGRVAAGGQTLDQLVASLTRILSDGYLLHPNVVVDIITYRPVYILGEVQKPGEYPYSETMTIYGLVAQAGGFTYRANRKTVKLRHEGQANDYKYGVTSATRVQPGDTIYVMQRYF